MEVPWNKFVLATGKIAEMNKIVEALTLKVVDAGFWPNKVVIGENWLSELPPESRKIKSFWIGIFEINAKVEVVSGDVIEVLEEAEPIPLGDFKPS